jgi:hypothetical protein
MKRAQLVFSRRWMAALAALAVVGVLAAPGRAPAQDAGVSGIPPGPANARGLNGSVNDPSGIGNAARVPSLPPPAIAPVRPPSVSAPVSSYRPLPTQRVVRFRRPPRFATARSRRAARAAIRSQDRINGGGVPSICRGC